MSDLFYRAFEEKHRGSRGLIHSRLQVYVPFVQPLLKAYPAGKALDVGCGRGEWLELLDEQGFDALGVDLDDGMLQACRERGLNVETADAVAYMKRLPASSLCIVSGFHVAEHLPFEVLQQLVQQALRVIVPGGLLILETPNPENIAVGTSSFYLDPTHQRPIPPELLSFLPEHYGFVRSKVMRLHESAHLHGASHIGLMDVLSGVSPDYAVVAQKQGAPLLMEALTPAFHTHYGLTLNHLVKRHEQAVDKRLLAIEARTKQVQEQAMQAETKAQQAQEQAMQAETKAQQAQEQAMQAKAQQAEIVVQKAVEASYVKENKSLTDELDTFRQELHAVHQANHSLWSQLEQTKQELHSVHQSNHHHWQLSEQRQAHLNALLKSTSWRITAPLRWPLHQLRLLRSQGFKKRAKAGAKKVLRKVVSWVVARPQLKKFTMDIAYKLGITQRLKSIVFSVFTVHEASVIQTTTQQVPADQQALTPHARQIYHDLKLAIEKRQKGVA